MNGAGGWMNSCGWVVGGWMERKKEDRRVGECMSGEGETVGDVWAGR